MPKHSAAPKRLVLFGIDTRALAALRVAVGLLLLADLLIRSAEVQAFLTDSGMFTRDTLSQMRGGRWLWSLHALRGDYWWQAGLLALHALLALLLVAGAWTRVVTVACWALTVSLQVRNPMIINAGDALLRMLLFWAMFLPWGECWSWDSARRRRTGLSGGHRQVVSLASAAALLQVCVAYWVTGALKLNDDWLGGQGLALAFHLDFCAKPAARWLLQFPWLLEAASRLVPLVQLGLPAAVWLPWGAAAVRTAVVFFFWLFHLTIDATIHVGLFGVISQTAWLLFLPPAFWDWLGRRAGWLRSEPRGASAAPAGRRASLWTAPVVGFSLLYVIASNAYTIGVHSRPPQQRLAEDSQQASDDGQSAADDAPQRQPLEQVALGGSYEQAPAWMPDWSLRLADLLMLEQSWTMFDHPPRRDTWLVARAWLADGRQVDLLRGAAPWDPSGDVRSARQMASQHWRYFFLRLNHPQCRFLAPVAAQFLLRDWNRRHGGDQQALAVDLVRFAEQYGESGFESEIYASAGAAPEPPLDLEHTLPFGDGGVFP